MTVDTTILAIQEYEDGTRIGINEEYIHTHHETFDWVRDLGLAIQEVATHLEQHGTERLVFYFAMQTFLNTLITEGQATNDQ